MEFLSTGHRVDKIKEVHSLLFINGHYKTGTTNVFGKTEKRLWQIKKIKFLRKCMQKHE